MPWSECPGIALLSPGVFLADCGVADGVPNDMVFDVDVPCPTAAEHVMWHLNSALVVSFERNPGVGGRCN